MEILLCFSTNYNRWNCYCRRSDSTFFISSGSGAWSGIYVYTKDYVVNIGDSVILDGEVDEYFDLTELVNVTNVQVISTGTTTT